MIKPVLYIALIWLLLSGSSQQAVSKEKVDARALQTRVIDACGERVTDKMVICLLSIGEVKRTDSLFGFNFSIIYNPDKIWFHSMIEINTLTEFFDLKDISIGITEGYISGYAFNSNYYDPPVYGNKPLIGILGDFLPDCPDTSLVSIDYIEFTDEFQKEIENYIPVAIESIVVDKPDRFLDPGFKADSVFFGEEKQKSIKLGFKTSEVTKIESISFELDFSGPEYKMNSIMPISDKVTNLSVDENGNIISVEADIDGEFIEEDLFEIFIEEKTDEDFVGNVKLGFLGANECSCVSRLGQDSFSLVSKKDSVIISVDNENEEEEFKAYYDRGNDEFVVYSERKAEAYSVYNINGIKLENNRRNIDAYIRINADNYSKGVYLIILNYIDEKKKIVLIKDQ